MKQPARTWFFSDLQVSTLVECILEASRLSRQGTLQTRTNPCHQSNSDTAEPQAIKPLEVYPEAGTCIESTACRHAIPSAASLARPSREQDARIDVWL